MIAPMKRLPILILYVLFWASYGPSAGSAAVPPPPPGTPEASYPADPRGNRPDVEPTPGVFAADLV